MAARKKKEGRKKKKERHVFKRTFASKRADTKRDNNSLFRLKQPTLGYPGRNRVKSVKMAAQKSFGLMRAVEPSQNFILVKGPVLSISCIFGLELAFGIAVQCLSSANLLQGY